MKGQYITTQIKIVTQSDKKKVKPVSFAKETIADTKNYRTIWTSDRSQKEELLYRLVF